MNSFLETKSRVTINTTSKRPYVLAYENSVRYQNVFKSGKASRLVRIAAEAITDGWKVRSSANGMWLT